MIQGEGAALHITIHGYENDAAMNESDANWLRCNARVDAHGFRGGALVAITTRDFGRFAAELRAVLDGSGQRAELVTDEDQIRATVELGRGGRAVIAGELSYDGGPKVRLSFTCQSDQTYLHRTLREVDTALATFPARGGSDE